MALRVTEAELGARSALAKGGMAQVFDLSEFSVGEHPEWPLVYKKYKRSIRPVPLYGLEAIVRIRDGWHSDQRRTIDRSFNWMIRVVTDNDPGAAGIILPRIDESYFITLRNSYGELMHKPAEGQFLAMGEEYFARMQLRFPSIEQRLVICRNLARGMALLHRAEVVYGDLSFRNFLFRLHPTPSVTYVDTDAVRPKGSSAALGLQPHTPDWEPPEAIAARKRGDSIAFAIQNYQSDRYKLALAILRILAINVPRAAERRDPTLAKPYLSTGLYRLLVQALTAPPDDRPDAKTWYEEFH